MHKRSIETQVYVVVVLLYVHRGLNGSVEAEAYLEEACIRN